MKLPKREQKKNTEDSLEPVKPSSQSGSPDYASIAVSAADKFSKLNSPTNNGNTTDVVDLQVGEKDKEPEKVKKDQMYSKAAQLFDTRSKEYADATKLSLTSNQDWNTYVGEQPAATSILQDQQRKQGQARIDDKIKRSKELSDMAIKTVDPVIKESVSELTSGENYTSLTMKDSSGNFEVPNPNAIREKAKQKALQYGAQEGGHFEELLYNNLKSEVTFKTYEKDAKKIFERDSKELIDKYESLGKKADESTESETVKLELAAKSLSEEIQAQAEAESKPIVEGYQQTATALNKGWEDYTTETQSKIAQIQAGAVNGIIDPTEAQATIDQLSAEYDTKRAEYEANFPNPSLLMDQLNQINGKYNKRLKREYDELQTIAKEKVSEIYKGATKEQEQLKARLNAEYSTAFKKAQEDRLSKMGALEKADANIVTNPMLAIGSLFAKSAASGLGGSLRGIGASMDSPSIITVGDYLESNYQIAPPKTKEWSDLLDPTNVVKLTGQLAGGMAPSIVAASATTALTGGLGAGAATQMVVGGLASFGAETAQMAGTAKADMFAKTGDAGEAAMAAEKTIDSQMDIMALYAFDALPFVGKALDFVPTKAGKAVVGGMSEIATETPQELLQGIAEENIGLGNEAWDGLAEKLNGQRIKETLISVAPTAFMGVGQLSGKSSKQQVLDLYIAQNSKAKMSSLLEDQGRQYVQNVVFDKGEKAASAMIGTLYSSGKIDQAQMVKMQEDVVQAVKLKENAKTLKLSPNDRAVYAFLSSRSDEAMKKAAEFAEDPVMTAVFTNQAKEYIQQAQDLVEGKDPNFFSIQYKDGSQYLFSEADAKDLFESPAFKDELNSKNVSIAAFGEPAAKILNNYAEQLNAPKESNTAAVLEEIKAGEDGVVEIDRDQILPELQRQRAELGVEFDPMDDLPDSVVLTFDRVEEGLPTDPTAVKEASNWLYSKYKALSAMKADPNRMLTIEQIESIQEQLGKDIETLENYTNENKINTEETQLEGQAISSTISEEEKQQIREEIKIPLPSLTENSGSGVSTGLFINSKGTTIDQRRVALYKKLGYTDEDIDAFSEKEALEIYKSQIEKPIVESTAKMETPIGESEQVVDEVVEPIDEGDKSSGVGVVEPKVQNFTQFANENGYPDDYDTSFKAQLLGGRGLEGQRQSNRSIKQQDEAFQEMQNKKAEGKKAYEQAILDGKVIDPDGKLTRESILKRDYDFDKKELESKIANAESGIKRIEGLGKMAYLDNGKLKKGYQRAVDDYNEQIQKHKSDIEKLEQQYEIDLGTNIKPETKPTDAVVPQPVQQDNVGKEGDKSNREQVKSKIDDIAEKVKAKLKAKGIEGKDIELMGTGSDQIIDALANMAKKLVDAGFTVKEAIDTILESAKERLDSEEYKSVETELRDKFKEEDGEDIEDKIDSPVTTASAVIDAFVNRSNMPQEIKDRIVKGVNDQIKVMSKEEMKAFGKDLIEKWGGIEKAIEEVRRPATTIPLLIQSVVYGEAMLYAQEKAKNAETEAEKEKWGDYEADVATELAERANEAGKFTSYISEIYKESPYSLVRKTKKELEAKNKMFAPKIKENVQDVKDTFENVEENARTIEGAVESLSESDQKALNERIKELEKQLADLQKEATTVKVDSTRKASLKKRYETEVKPAADRLKKRFSEISAGAISLANSPFADPEVWKDLSKVAKYVLESGSMKFEQFYKKIKKELGGIAEETYADLYKEQKQTLIEAGEKASSFDNDVDVDRVALDYFQKEQKLKDEIEALKQKEEVDKLTKEYGKILSESIPYERPKADKMAKLNELAEKLDAFYGGDSFRSGIDDFVGITQEEKQNLATQRKISDFGKLLSSDTTERKAGKTKQERLSELATALDAEFGGNNFTKTVEDYLAIEQDDKAKRSKQKEIKDFFSKISSTVPQEPKAKVDRETQLRDKAKQLDLEFGGNNFTKTVDDYFKIKEQEKQQREKQQKAQAFFKKLSQSIPQGTKEKRDVVLKREAAELDAQFGGTSFTDQLNQYLSIQDADKTQSKKENEIKAKAKELFAQMSQAAPTTPDRRTRKEKMIEKAKELDAFYGGNAYETQVNAYFAEPQSSADRVKEALIKAGFGKEVGGKQQVDWAKLTTDSKNVNDTIEKIKQALQGVLPQNEIDFVVNQIDKVITEKKANEISKKVKSITRYKARRLLGVLRSRNKILDLVNIWKQGGLSNKVIQEKLGADFGFSEFTAENEAWVENKIKEIELAPMGAERELLEEQLQAYLEDIGAPLISLNRILEKNKARLLSGFVTQLKNIAGSQDSMIAAIYKGLHTQVTSLINSGATDKEINKVIKKAHKIAMMTSLDILLNGGVDTGIAISETTGTKEGSPRVRYMENERRKIFKPLIVNALGRDFNINPLNWEKYPQRSMAAVDAFNQIILQEMGSYTYIKNDLLKKNPNMSSKQAGAKAYEIMYSVDRDAAIKQAEKEFTDRGIDISATSGSLADRSRFYRRVNEIIAGARSGESVKKGQRFANKQTYKEADYGAMSLIIEPMKVVQSAFRNAGKKWMRDSLKSGDKAGYQAAKTINAVSRVTFDQFFPFVVSVGNIVEKGLEWYPTYGMAKSAAYLGVATVKKLKGDDMSQTEYDFERAGLYATKAAAGMAITLLIKSLADDDEEEGIALYGQGSEDWRERKNRQQQRPANTVRINGRNYGLDLFGALSLSLKIEAIRQDKLKYAKNSDPTMLSILGAAASDLYLQKLNKAIKAFEKQDEKNNGFTQFIQGESAELLTRSVLPFTASARQLDQAVNGNAERALTFVEKLSKFSGIYGGWMKSRPAFDYRGKTYKVGEIYTSGGAGVVNMINQQTPIDKADKLVFKYNAGLTQISNQDESLEFLDEELGQYMPMDKLDYYDFQKDASQRFNKLIVPFAEFEPEGKIQATTPPTANQIDKAMKEAKLEFIANGNPNPSEEDLNQKTLEIAIENKNNDKISRKISKLNSLSQKAALEDYYISKGIPVPFALQNSKSKYDSELVIWEMLSKIKK